MALAFLLAPEVGAEVVMAAILTLADKADWAAGVDFVAECPSAVGVVGRFGRV